MAGWWREFRQWWCRNIYSFSLVRRDVHADVSPRAAIPATEPPLHLFVGVDNATCLLGFIIEQKIVTLSAVSCWINSDFPVWKTSDSFETYSGFSLSNKNAWNPKHSKWWVVNLLFLSQSTAWFCLQVWFWVHSWAVTLLKKAPAAARLKRDQWLESISQLQLVSLCSFFTLRVF